jgi:hypothetical protein
MRSESDFDVGRPRLCEPADVVDVVGFSTGDVDERNPNERSETGLSAHPNV